MTNPSETGFYHSNRYSAVSACHFCDGVINHEPWCIEKNANIRYAFYAVMRPGYLTWADRLILHSLGVCWD